MIGYRWLGILILLVLVVRFFPISPSSASVLAPITPVSSQPHHDCCCLPGLCHMADCSENHNSGGEGMACYKLSMCCLPLYSQIAPDRFFPFLITSISVSPGQPTDTISQHPLSKLLFKLNLLAPPDQPPRHV